jgi:serine/threonine-protein kinase
LVANILLVMVFGGISAWVVTKLLPAPQAPSPITSFTVPIPGGRFLGQQPAMALSPDGEAMVFRGEGGLHVRPLSELDTRLLEGTAGGYNPFFSPDGRFVAFVQGGVFKKVALDGGPVAEIAPIPDGWLQGADWGEDGHIVFSGIGGVRRIPAAGGPLEIITSVDSTSEHMHMWPQLLEGGRTLLFTAMGPSAQWADAKIVIKDLASGDQSVVVEGGTFGRYLPTGHILYATVSGTIMAVPFDLASWSMEGDPVPIESGVHVAAWGGGPQVAVSPAGNAAFIRGSVWEDHRLLMVDRSGGERQLGDPVKTYFSRISPDGSRAAVTLSRPGQTNIHLLDLSSGDLEHLTFGTPFHDTAVWSPDGQSIAFSADWVNGVSQVFLQPVDPAAPATLLFTGDYHIHLMDWSPDGQWIVFFYVVPETGYDLYAVRVDSADHVIPVRATVASESSAKFSTDGDWLAYGSDGEVYLTPFPPTEGSGQVAVGRGSSPRWARDWGELFFRRGQTLLVAEVSTAGTLSLGPPRPLFDLPENTVRYDVTADGRQFLVAIRNPDAEVREIEVVVNWLREMEERMGGEG